MEKKGTYLHAVVLVTLLLGWGLLGRAQEGGRETLQISRTETAVKLDGRLDDPAWKQAAAGGKFSQYFPYDTSLAFSQTEVMFCYDDHFLYCAAKMYDSLPGEYVSLSLRRDFVSGNVDAFTLVLDPFQDKTNGMAFGLNPFGVQREGLVSAGGTTEENLDLSWDNKWYSAVQVEDSFWIAELAIPFKTLRFKEGSTRWGMNCYRTDTKSNERSAWSRVPRQFPLHNLAFTGELLWDEPLGAPGANISVIPYLAANASSDFLGEKEENFGLTGGGDVKIAVTPSLNLDLTANPDFSQIEVDVQQTNIDRFELFFPERRQFFLENADLFSNFGFSNAQPFFSRRIGVAIDSTSGQNVQNQIIAGARLSGRLDENWRIGLMNMQTAEDVRLGVPAFNYSVGVVQRQVFDRSNISGIFVNKQNFDEQPVDIYDKEAGSYSRLAGLDYNLASADGKWTGKAFYHYSFDEGPESNAYSTGANLLYNTRRFRASLTTQAIGDGFDARVGFLPRKDIKRLNPVLGYNLFPESGWINQHAFELSNNWTWNDTWGITDYNFSASWTVTFQSTAQYNFSLLSNYVKLFSPFNPTGNPTQLFQPGEGFSQTGFLSWFQSDQRQPFSFRAQMIYGGFFNGTLLQLSGNVDYRYQQYATFSLTYNINHINLNEGFDDARLYLVGSRLALTLNKDLFWTTFVQYNSQFENININSRLQWRFQPASDFFLVYTDNYFPESLRVKNRALVAKVSYWLNL